MKTKVIFQFNKESKALSYFENLDLGKSKLFNKNEMFAVILPDDIILSKIPVTKQLITIYNKTGGSVIGLEKVPKMEVFKYGIVEKDNDLGQYCSIKNIVDIEVLN